MIHIILGGAGCGKSTRLIQMLQQQISQGEHVLTLVPEQFSYEFDQKLYHVLGASAFNQLETYSFKALARAIFQRYGSKPDGKTNADELTRTALIYQAVLQVAEQEKKLRVLGRQCRQPSFVDELSVLFSLLRRIGTTPASLYDSCTALNGRLLDKTLDLFSIYQKYDQLLTLHQLKDTETDLTEAAVIANGQDAFLGDILCVDEFESFTEDEYEMLSVLISSCKDVFLALRTDEIDSVPFSLFDTVNQTLYRVRRMAEEYHIPVEIVRCEKPYRFASEDLAWLSEHAFRSSITFEGKAPNIHILEASTPNEEAEYVCATICHLLENDRTLRCRDIAVLTNQLSAYQSTLETVMERYALPYHLDEKQSMQHMPLMVYLHTVLELLQSKHPNTELLFRFGKTGLTDCTLTEIAELENYCYAWQIEGETWQHPFTGGNFAAVEETRKKLLDPIHMLQKACRGPHMGAAYCKILYNFVDTQKIQVRLQDQLAAFADDSFRMQAQEDWIYVWNNWMDILDRMASLYADVEFNLSEFCAVLRAMMRTIHRSVPPRTLDAILISQGSTARLNEPKVVFLLGVCEGAFPLQSGGNGFFSERDCLALEEQKLPIMKSKAEQLADARLAAYKLLSSASHALYLTYPCVNAAQQKCYPAAVWIQIQRMFLHEKMLKQTSAELGSAYYAVTLHAAYYRYIQDYAVYSVDTASIEQILLQDSFYQKRLHALMQLTQQYAGHVDAPLFHIDDTNLMQKYIGSTIQLSASGLETYQLCPFSYFCNNILRLVSRQKIQVAGAGSGSMIHYCLEQLLKRYDRSTFLQLSPQMIEAEVRRDAAQFWQGMMGGDFSKSGRELAAYHHTICDMRQMILHLQEEFRQSAFYPHYLELQISSENPDFPPLELEVESGKKIRLIGKVDRVDLCEDEGTTWIRVVDYKSGAKDFSIGNLLYGLDLQMLIYLFTITASESALSKAIPAGVLYMPSGKIKSELERGSAIAPQKQCNDTYRMNGVLLRDAHLITLMEQEGRGIYIPAKLDAEQNIDDRSGTFLTKKQMEHLRQYVFYELRKTAEQIYQGEIDANPLQLQKHDGCAYCSYVNICGNISKQHCRKAVGTQTIREKQMLEKLEENDTERSKDN